MGKSAGFWKVPRDFFLPIRKCGKCLKVSFFQVYVKNMKFSKTKVLKMAKSARI